MNTEGIKEFIDKVKGKRIRWSVWPRDEYFTPNGVHDSRHMEGVADDGVSRHWDMMNGLKSYGSDNNYWEFCKTQSGEIDFVLTNITVDRAFCTCDLYTVVMVTGCQCGGG